MKAIIYAGIGLFSVASVYGVIDYYGAKKQGVFNNLYTEKAEPAVAAANNPATTAVLKTTIADAPLAAVEKKVLTAKEKKAKKMKRTINFKSFSRGEIIEEMPVTEPAPISIPKPVTVAMAEPVPAPVAAPAEQPVEKPAVKEEPAQRPKIDMRMFSRSPLKRQVKKEKALPEKTKEQ
jgi:hypothetical protein